MAVNLNPIFPLTPNVGGTFNVAVTAANTALDGTGTVTTVYTAGANGSFVQGINFKPAGTNIQTVARIFLNNGSTNATAANNILIGEITLPASTAAANAQVPEIFWPFNRMINAGYKLNIALGTAVAGGYLMTGFGGDY